MKDLQAAADEVSRLQGVSQELATRERNKDYAPQLGLAIILDSDVQSLNYMSVEANEEGYIIRNAYEPENIMYATDEQTGFLNGVQEYAENVYGNVGGELEQAFSDLKAAREELRMEYIRSYSSLDAEEQEEATRLLRDFA